MTINLGFYIDTNAGTPQNIAIYEFLNKQVEDRTLKDATVFFNDVQFNPINNKFGMFDATDIWSFTGVLLSTTVINALRTLDIVNKFKSAYLYSKENKSEQAVLKLLVISNRMPIFVLNEEDATEIYRLTGVKPHLMDGFSLDKIKEVFNE